MCRPGEGDEGVCCGSQAAPCIERLSAFPLVPWRLGPLPKSALWSVPGLQGEDPQSLNMLEC